MQSIEFLDQIRNADGPLPTAKIRLDMQKAMQADAAVFRYVVLYGFFAPCKAYYIIVCSTQESLDEGVQKIRNIYNSYEKVGIKDRSMIWNS